MSNSWIYKTNESQTQCLVEQLQLQHCITLAVQLASIKKNNFRSDNSQSNPKIPANQQPIHWLVLTDVIHRLADVIDI